MKNILNFIIFIILSINTVYAAKIEKVTVYSKAMQKNTSAYVVLPEKYHKDSTKEYPVLYLLHGFGGDYSSYPNDFPAVKKQADEYNMVIVSADGGYSSWYFDSPIDPKMKYETYITKELITFIDSNYSTINNRKGRAICGLSMGGHGALYLSMRHSDLFGAAGSMSGGVDIRPFPKNWEIASRLGGKDKFPLNWEKNTVMNQLDSIKDTISFMIDCGTEDFFLEVNRQLHAKMLTQKIKHDYVERPGGHEMGYWKNSIKYQLLFFDNYFKEAKLKQ
jgi:S-formylglutathione hydrolase FrmB